MTLTFSLTGCAYDGPSLADQGDVDFAVVNQVGEDMHVDIWTMDEGYTFEEFSTYVDEERERLESGIQPLGPPDAVTMLSTIEVARGATGTETLGVSEGTIGFACIAFDGEQGTMHAAGPLEVTS